MKDFCIIVEAKVPKAFFKMSILYVVPEYNGKRLPKYSNFKCLFKCFALFYFLNSLHYLNRQGKLLKFDMYRLEIVFC